MKYTPILCLVLAYAAVITAACGIISCTRRAANHKSTRNVTLEAGDGRLSPGGTGGTMTVVNDLVVTAPNTDGRRVTELIRLDAGGRWRDGAGRELTYAEAGKFMRENIRRLECLDKRVQNEAK